jgi:hypothetical protein
MRLSGSSKGVVFRLMRRILTVGFCAIVSLLLIAHLPLVFQKRSGRGVVFWARGSWVLRVNPSQSWGLACWKNRSAEFFGTSYPMYGCAIGWTCYLATKQPQPSEVLERLESENPDDLNGALWCLIRIPNPAARDRLCGHKRLMVSWT